MHLSDKGHEVLTKYPFAKNAERNIWQDMKTGIDFDSASGVNS
jgi:hypothetical protein